MTSLIKYALADGMITGIWEGSPPSLLASQIPVDDIVSGYLPLEDDIPTTTLAERYWVALDVLQSKATLVLTPDVSTFAADGVAVCTITVVPFLACAVQVNGGSPVALTAGDPTLELTADLPQQFTVTLAPIAEAWAEAVTVEAV